MESLSREQVSRVESTFTLPWNSTVDGVVFLAREAGIEHYIGTHIDKARMVVTFSVLDSAPPVEVWSTGEQLLWKFFLSLAGRERINLGETAAYFRHTTMREMFISTLASSFRTDQERHR